MEAQQRAWSSACRHGKAKVFRVVKGRSLKRQEQLSVLAYSGVMYSPVCVYSGDGFARIFMIFRGHSGTALNFFE